MFCQKPHVHNLAKSTRFAKICTICQNLHDIPKSTVFTIFLKVQKPPSPYQNSAYRLTGVWTDWCIDSLMYCIARLTYGLTNIWTNRLTNLWMYGPTNIQTDLYMTNNNDFNVFSLTGYQLMVAIGNLNKNCCFLCERFS